jgi:hypothetical protein
MKIKWLFLILALSSLVVGCTKLESFSTGDDSKWRDPNFKIIPITTYNYTNHEIGRTYILPPKANDIENAAMIGGAEMTKPNATSWVQSGGNSPDLAWDLRWKPPQRLKVWWLRVVDEKVLSKSSDQYDIYKNKETEKGTAWCEYEIEIKEPFNELLGVMPYPNMRRNVMVLYFFPDGTVKGHMEFPSDAEVPIGYRVDIKLRDQLPTIKDKACLKEIPNPLYGKRKPTTMN